MFDIFHFTFQQTIPAIGFHVALCGDKSNPPSNIEFDVVLRHYGKCWNRASKMFVAPVTGMYSFLLTIMNHNKVCHEEYCMVVNTTGVILLVIY